MPSRRLYSHTLRAAHHVRSTVDAQSKARLGVTSAQMGMLFLIRAAPGCPQREVAEQMGVRESAVTASVGRLVKQGLVRRARVDGRTNGLWLTKSGASMVAQALPMIARVEAALSAGFTDAELDVVQRFLDTALSLGDLS